MGGNNSSGPGAPVQPALRPQSGLSGPGMMPQSQPTPSSLPPLGSRPPPPPPSQTPDMSAASQLSTSYPSPGQQGSSAKPASNSLAQLEQMVMPGSGPSTAIKSPTLRSTNNSPGTNAPSQMQYSYNASGQGSYFNSAAGPNQSSYYSSYDSSGAPEAQKSLAWSDRNSSTMMNPPPPGSSMMEGGPPSSYNQSGYDGSSGYSEYTQLSTPSQSRFPAPADMPPDPHQADKNDPYAIDSQTFDDHDEQSTTTKTKKSRAKKGDDSTKKERKQRAPRAPKGSAAVPPAPVAPPLQPQSTSMTPMPPVPSQSISPTCNSTLQPLHTQVPIETPSVLPESLDQRASTPPAMQQSMAMREESSEPMQQQQQPPKPYPSPNHQSPTIKPPSNNLPQSDQMPMTNNSQPPPPTIVSKSPVQRSGNNSPIVGAPPMQYQYNQSGPEGYYNASQQSYPPPYDSSSGNVDKSKPAIWNDQPAHPMVPDPSGAGSSVIEGTSSATYGEPGYGPPPPGYSDYTQLSTTAKPGTYQPTSENSQEPCVATKSDADVIDKPTTEEQGEQQQQQTPKSKKSRSKKGDESSTKRERRPRAPKATKGATASTSQPQSPSGAAKSLLGDQPSFGVDNESTIGASLSSPRHPSSGGGEESIETTVQYPGESQSVLDGKPTDEAAGAKPKKSRAKKGDPDRPKKERKSRAAAPKTAPTETSELSTPPPPSTTTTTQQPSFNSADESLEVPAIPEAQIESTPTETKPKRIRIRDSGSKGKKKLPKFALKFAKTKKRKRLGSSDNEQSDLDKTPPPSPDEIESGVQKRRSARNTKKLKYNDDIELGFSDSDDSSQILPKKKASSANTTTASAVDGETTTTVAEESVVEEEPTVYAAPVEDTMVVEKIMASRTGKRELEPEPGEVLPPDGTHIDVEEFYVKYKNMSYLHCDWRTLEELEKGDRRVAQKIKRYKQKKDNLSMFSFMEDELFDPQYCEVDRILAVNEVEEMVPETDEDEVPDKENDLDKQSVPALEQTNNNSNVDNNGEVKPMETDEQKPLDVKATLETNEDNKEVNGQTDDKGGEAPKHEELNAENGQSVPVVKVDENVIKAGETKGENQEPAKTVKTIEENSIQQKSADGETNEIKVEEKPRKMKKKISRHYLVKWRALSYEDSTWELEEHLDPDKIKQFERFKDPPPKSKWKQVKRPKPEEWVRKEASPVYKNNNTLREYQLEGINWLSFCWHQGRNCILADEMGLGKTIQSIAFINEIYEYGINGPFLIIVPLSTVGNWAREFETWTDLNVITYHGSSTSREMLKEYEMFYRNEQGNRITSYYKFQVMITTFEIILSDCLDLREIPWKCCIIDEAHRLKNRNCKLLEGLRLLNMEHRVLLTGTPLQNNVEELFSLLNFLEPTQFSSTEQFLQEFGDLKTEAQVDKLKLILKPMMLRRLKEDVEKTLAPKEETIVEVELTNIQKKYYRAILERNFSFLSKGTSSNNMPNLMNTMMELRKCCIHPYLINGAEEQILYEAKEARLSGGEPMSSHQAMVNSSGKLVLIDKLLPRLRADGHRVLIFSQMVRCLDILEDYVTHKHYPYERIDGRVRGGDRQQAIDRYSKPGSDRFVFLLCTRAGGLGINLTAADTVIIFDSDWNPQNDLQAQARCHRIGQSKAVKIYRLICRNTYEREMFDKASLKLGLDKAVLQSMNTQKATGGVDGQLTKKEIEELLRKGAYGALMDDDNAGDKFCEEDIDQILQRRTQVITIDNSEAKGSTFSKATFSSSNNREDIELDDPNFWEKWAKKANLESDELRGEDELIQLAPRRRTQTKRYGADGNLLEISDLDSSEEDEDTISMRTRGSRRGQPKSTPQSASKRGKRRFEFDDDDYTSNLDGGYWSKSDCLKIEDGLLTYGWGRWEEIIANNRFKRDISVDDCENICRVILLYCLNSYKGDEKIKSFVWELISPNEESNKSETDTETTVSTRGRKPKSAPPASKKSTAEEISDANWPKEAKNDPLIALPDDQYRRHLQRNCNR